MNLKENLNLASLDGGAGGARTFSQLETMRLIMHQKNYSPENGTTNKLLPCEVFDLIGGSDTGGLIALMLVKLKMSVEEAFKEFKVIVEEVYDKDLEPAARTKSLRECMVHLLQRKGKRPDLRLEDEGPSKCKGFVLATPKTNTMHNPCLRTYKVGKDLPSDITVVDAVLATCASPPYFLPASFEADFRTQEYLGTHLAASNPIRSVITEAVSLFREDSRVSSLLSLGSGDPGAIVFPPGGISTNSLHEVALCMLRDCEKLADEMQGQIGLSGVYFRFSVVQGAPMNAPRRDDRSWVLGQTSAYLSRNLQYQSMEKYIAAVNTEPGSITCGNLKGILKPAKVDTPVPTVDTPVPTVDTPVPTANNPVPTVDTPVPTANNPVPTADNPFPIEDTDMEEHTDSAEAAMQWD